MIVVAIIGMLAAIAIPNFVNAREKAKRTACIQNLKQLDGAKQQWSIENRAAQTATPTPAQIQPYLGRGTGGVLPTCPSDQANTFATSYSLNDLQTVPTCLIQPGVAGDITGHRLE